MRKKRMKRLAILAFVTGLVLGIASGPAFSAPGTPAASTKKAKKESAKAGPSKKAPAKAAKPQAAPKNEAAKPGEKPEAKPGDAAKAVETKPATYKIKKRLFKIELSLDGAFEAKALADVVLRPEEWSDFEVLKAVEHGTPVRRGDLLVSIETEKIDRAIADLERDLSLSRLGLRDTETQLQAARTSGPLELASATRSKRMIDEDLAHFLKVERAMFERTADFNLKTTENYLAYEKEELRQLEKMYKADDLTEETEEIILRRARDSVARAQFMADRAKLDRNSMFKTGIPRAEDALKLSAQRQAVELWKTQVNLPAAQRKLELSLEKMKVDLGRSEERLKRLVADRKQMNVKAPISGIAYYGKIVRGRWSGAEPVADKLRRGGRLSGDDVFMTIVDPRPLAIRASASEKQLQNLTAGLKGVARPTAFPDLKLPAIVERVSGVPSAAKDFDAAITVALGEEARAVMPGMGCEVRFVPYLKTNAVAIPAAALGTDEIDSQKQLVALPGKNGQPVRREVVVGKRTDKLVEILKGLSEGEEILAEFPKEKE